MTPPFVPGGYTLYSGHSFFPDLAVADFPITNKLKGQKMTKSSTKKFLRVQSTPPRFQGGPRRPGRVELAAPRCQPWPPLANPAGPLHTGPPADHQAQTNRLSMQGRGDTMPCLFLLLHGDLYLVLDILYISIKNIKNFMQKYFNFLTRYAPLNSCSLVCHW